MPKEYIEREAVEKMLEDAQVISDGEYTGYCIEDVSISSIPTADVVEVVRCKDCKWYESRKNYAPYCNNVMNLFEEMKLDDFCSYGERRIK